MKKNLVLSLLLFSVLCIRANADITLEQASDAEYLINSGYSEAAAEEVFLVKNRINGKACEPLYDKESNKTFKFIKNFCSYLDPALDNDERLHHDVEQSPSYKDL